MKYIAIIISFSIGLFAGYKIPKETTEAKPILFQNRFSHFEYTHPLLSCDLGNNQDITPEFEELGKRIANQIDTNSDVEDIGVYIKQLNSGKWFGINENKEFTSASLGKIAVMMTFFKQTGTGNGLLNDTLTNDGRYQNSLNTSDDNSFAVGSTHTVLELIQLMIIHSDNISTLFLKNYASVRMLNTLNYVKEYFNLAKNIADPVASPRSFGLIFEVLYNSTFLSAKYSDLALSLMAQSDYDYGISAGVDKDVRVSNKFGLRNREGETIQLHDCGIVYVPENPYVICVMTRGKSEDIQEKLISEISYKVYQSMKK